MGLLSVPSLALANPFYVGRYRGLSGGPVDNSAWDVYWNPANLARTGGSVAFNLQAISRTGTFDRDAALNEVPESAIDVNTGKNETGALGFVPGLAARHGWRLGKFNLGIGGTFFVARAGTSSWKKTLMADARHAGAADGPQRWATINTRMTVISGGLGLGASYRPWKLSVGLTPVINFASLGTVRARNLDQTEDLYQADGRLKEGRVLLEDGTDERFTLIAGVRWDPLDNLGFGFTWHGGTTYDLQGRARIQAGTEPEQQVQARLPLQVAHSFRFGVRYAPLDWLTLRPEFHWHMWSVMDQQVATNNSPEDPGYGDELIPIYRLFQDSFSVRLAADFQVLPTLGLHASVGYESAVNRDQCSASEIQKILPHYTGESRPWCTFEPGLAESPSIELGAGVSVELPWQLRAMLSYTYHQFEDVRVTGSIQKPMMNGDYTDVRHYVSLDLEYTWGSKK